MGASVVGCVCAPFKKTSVLSAACCCWQQKDAYCLPLYSFILIFHSTFQFFVVGFVTF